MSEREQRDAMMELAVRARRSYLTDPEFHAMVTLIVQEKLAKRESYIVGGYFLAMLDDEPWLFEAHPGSTGPDPEPPSSEPLAPLRVILDATVKSLVMMQDEVVEFEHSKGWQPNDNTFGDSLALLHSEVSEMLEAFREVGFAKRVTVTEHDCEWGGCKRCGSTNLDLDPCLNKPDDVASEAADVFIRLLSTFAQFLAPHGFDLAAEYERKMHYNRSRPHRHGGKAL